MIRTCDRGHASLDAANWKCPWCEIERLRAEAGRLREALMKIRDVEPNWGAESYEMYELANTALKEGICR